MCNNQYNDETLPKENTQEREKKNKGQGPKSKQAKNPKEVGHLEVRETTK